MGGRKDHTIAGESGSLQISLRTSRMNNQQLPPPPHMAAFTAGLAAQCIELTKAPQNILPTIQGIMNSLSFIISKIEPEASREVIINTIIRDLPIMVDKLLDITRKTPGGIIVPGVDDKGKFT